MSTSISSVSISILSFSSSTTAAAVRSPTCSGRRVFASEMADGAAAMSPIAALASVHCAAATENFMVLENHSVDQLEQWSSLVEGLPVPLIEDGYIAVPEAPGLGFTDLNEDVMREFADPGGPKIFASTEDWDDEHAHDRLWS